MIFEAIKHPVDVRSWPGEIPIAHTYTVGLAGERFLRTLKEEGRFTGTRCPHCEITYVPARLFCERCLAPLNEHWVDVGPNGTIQSFTILHLDPDGSRRIKPDVVIAVQLDGADTVLIHRLAPNDANWVEIGARVTPVFLPAELREGSILDIDFFELL